MTSALLERPYYDKKGFDNNIFDDEHRMYGVFDGMGTSEGARNASALAATKFFKHRSDGFDAGQLGAIIDDVSKSIAVHYPTDGTTATVARIDSDGRLHYAHVGDSRLYVMLDGRIKQMTADEGYGNRLLNYCGPYSHGCCQIGILDEDQWDAFMICSDGVTGDWKEQLLSDSQIETVMSMYKPTDICHKLVQLSMKDDDKTIIVVEK